MRDVFESARRELSVSSICALTSWSSRCGYVALIGSHLCSHGVSIGMRIPRMFSGSGTTMLKSEQDVSVSDELCLVSHAAQVHSPPELGRQPGERCALHDADAGA